MSETLAEPEIDSETDTQTGTRRALTLALQGEVFAIDAGTVREILDMPPVTQVPNASPFANGLINVRGRVVPLVDLRVTFGMERSPKTVKAAAADELLSLVGMADSAQAMPHTLSGGQQQRVAIARAIVGERRLVLADEPTGALDTETGEEILRLLRARCDAGAAGVLVTHEARHAAWADRVVFLRDGVVVDESGSAPVDDLLEAGHA